MDIRERDRHHANLIFRWLKQVCPDKRLKSSAFKVGFQIAQHINKDTGLAFPGTRRLAELTGLSQPAVVGAVHALKECGYLDVWPGRKGRGYSNRYRLRFPRGAEADGENVHSRSGDIKPNQDYHIDSPAYHNHCPPEGGVISPPLTEDTEDQFNKLARLYPRVSDADRADALIEYQAVLENGMTHDEMIEYVKDDITRAKSEDFVMPTLLTWLREQRALALTFNEGFGHLKERWPADSGEAET